MKIKKFVQRVASSDLRMKESRIQEQGVMLINAVARSLRKNAYKGDEKKKVQHERLISTMAVSMVLLAGCGGVSDTTTNYVLEDNTGIIYNMHGEPVRNMGTWTDPEFGCEYLIFYHEGLVSNFSSIASAGLSIRYDSDGKPICKGKQ